ncbi:carbonic anhydrase [Mucilaginibacter polytrichastri]|uniref:Carbonic anhydrase 2 n=1 Tax=Mucilaginibacter polytrichastri TaxID=1302689 RepID=A0A1Q5ZSI4_9SPHI|nr:carbonic anhydrase [Mucilaginibacter polytrichastri]OKS84726.1 Carbonic anhydrase [Mucilaginibacter polytrichastri]SFT01034.1 carbonic anhydrase [Mucilaginibacter polytrichastri]
MLVNGEVKKEIKPAIDAKNIQLAQKSSYESLIKGNADWVEKRLKEDPEYFHTLAKGQHPEVLWIGCSDSRVPANEVTGTKPGEVFVHRNIANVCVHSDMNMLSVLDYAVNVLKVKHVIVAGHYGCGGVAAALSKKQFGLIDNWLRNIKDVYRLHSHELDRITDETAKVNRLVELNVVEQVYNLCKTTIIQNAWTERHDLEVHGWVIDIGTGLVKDLGVTNSGAQHLGYVYELNDAKIVAH